MSSPGSKRPPTRPRGGRIREQRPDAALDVLAAGTAHKHGRSTRLHSNKLHQTCRPVNQFEHVLRRGVPADHEAHSQPKRRQLRRVATTELRRECTPEAEAGCRTTARRSERKLRERSRAEHASHDHIHTPVNPLGNQALSASGPDRNDDVMTSTHSGWRGRRWCWSVQQTTRQRVPRGRSRETEQSKARRKAQVCRRSRHRLSDKVFPADAREWQHTRHGGVHDQARE